MKTKTFLLSALLMFFFSSFSAYSTNPEISNYLINISEGSTGSGNADYVPEIVISGNTIHTVWVQSVGNSEAYLYYRRSVDLGETWEPARQILALKYRSYAIQVDSRKLAVDGDNVHICIADYDYNDNGTGRVFYLRSQNGGASFEKERVVAATSGGYKEIENCFIKAANGKVVVAYQGTGNKKGTWALFSSDSGTSFTDTKISDESSYVNDLFYDGEQMIVLYGYYTTSYGYITVGKVWVSVSQNGTSFVTSKISVIYTKSDKDAERCRVTHGDHYSSKISSSGNNIHVVFSGYTTGDIYTTFYARSINKGTSFEPAVDIGTVTPELLQEGSETVAAMNGNVYLLAATQYPTNNNSGNRFYFSYSDNNGSTFSEMLRIMNPEISHVGKSSLPGITIDTKDNTGKTLILTGNWLFSTKSADGGKTFSGSTSLAPFLESNIINMSHNYMNSFLTLDSEGGKHWISSAKWRSGTDNDIFYRNVKKQPEPGSENKALYVEDLKGTYQAELVVVPSSESINFDSAMTAEVWIKFNPETMANFNILAKVNGYDGYYDQPKGYQMGFIQEKGKIKINAGIKTDKGEFVNKSEFDLNDNLWHHIAFTYDANGGLNNFKMYINGLLQMEKTVTGAIFSGDAMLMIGSRAMGNSWYYDAKYYLDDVRLWNRALTQKELMENQTKKLTGHESGLKMFLNFDDTFKDISGNGNDGIPVYRGTLDVSDFDPPITSFDMFQTLNTVSFNNKTKNATSWMWDFGDTKTSDQGNPNYVYTTPGEYSISLLAKNANSVTAAIGHATIEGLDRIEPTKAGNYGITSITVFGGNLGTEGTEMILRKEGQTDIIGEFLESGSASNLTATFDLSNADLGKWDVVVKKNGAEQILQNEFTIVNYELPNTWANLTGQGAALINRWTTYTINYGNTGNIDAFMVPIQISISSNGTTEIEMIDFEIEESEVFKEYINADGSYSNIETIKGTSYDSKLISFIIPVIPANSTSSVHIRIKSSENFYVNVYDFPPLLQNNPELNETLKSIAVPDLGTFAKCLAEAAFDEIVKKLFGSLAKSKEFAECAYSVSKETVGYLFSTKTDRAEKSVFLSITGVALDCAAQFGGQAVKTFLEQNPIIKGTMAVIQIASCILTGKPAKWDIFTVLKRIVSSFDPNEMVGPSGFGDKNWIQRYSPIPYTILFENKKEATAPAHDVFIIDTLDLSKFNLEDFGFAAFGWGDTILYPPGNKLKEFSMDVDLRPEINLITRVSAKLDTITGIVKWEFLSLNPTTLDLEEDPFTGFLPPNKTSPEGEGFVSFSVGLNDKLGTNDNVRNKASIVFDANEPIFTNEYLNTFDMDVPESKVNPLPETIDGRFPVSWSGTDKGSGIASYTVFVLENDTLLIPWLVNTTETNAMFEGKIGFSYKFYSIVTDNVGHIENSPDGYDASTTITVDVEEFDRLKEKLQVWPNPVNNNLNINLTNAPCGMYVVELVSNSGSVQHSQLYSDLEIQNGIKVNVNDFKTGQYILRIVFGNKTETRKIIIQ